MSEHLPGMEPDLFTDRTMRELVARYGVLSLKRRIPFEVLARSIIAQQVSTKAADTIRRRLNECYGTGPESVVKADVQEIRAFGLTESKAECLQRVATLAIAGDFECLEELDDSQIAARLQKVKGIGPWTAHMFLIFSLARPDVWPVSDGGLYSATRKLYAVDSRNDLQSLGKRFAPQRSLAALYLWRSLENT